MKSRNLFYRQKWKVFVFLLNLVVWNGCGEGVPSVEKIRCNYDLFLIDADEVKGIYENYDVDCIVFSYKTKIAKADEFWSMFEERYNTLKPKNIVKGKGIIKFEVIKQPKQMQSGRVRVGSVEAIKVAYIPKNQKVVIAIVQADSRGNEYGFIGSFDSDGGSEAEFAYEHIWPLFEKECESE